MHKMEPLLYLRNPLAIRMTYIYARAYVCVSDNLKLSSSFAYLSYKFYVRV